jgi:hypothetical protein
MVSVQLSFVEAKDGLICQRWGFLCIVLLWVPLFELLHFLRNSHEIEMISREKDVDYGKPSVLITFTSR